MPYNETFEKLKAAQNPAFAEEIEAVKDNQTFFIGAYESSPEGNTPKGDFNEIFQALLNNDKALKKLAEAIQARTITAGKGLQGGGALSKDVTLNVVSVNDAIIVNDNDIQLNPVNDLTTGGTDKALSGEMGKKLNNDKQNKTDSGLQTDSKEIVGAINESLWRRIAKELPVTDLNLMNAQSKGVYYKTNDVQNILNRPVNDSENFYVEWSGFASQTGILRYWSWDSKKVYRKYRLTNGTWTPWQEELDSGSSLFLGNAGITSVVYIQDAGSKTRGNGYIDKTTGKLYLCYPEDESVDTVNDVTVTKNFTLATNIANTNSIVSSKKSKYLGKKPVNSTFDVGEDFRNYKFIQVDLLSNRRILSTIVTTTNSKINQSVQFSGSAGENNNLAIFVTFNATNLVTQLIRNCDEVQIILTN